MTRGLMYEARAISRVLPSLFATLSTAASTFFSASFRSSVTPSSASLTAPIRLLADAEVGRVHQARHRRQDLLPVEVLAPQVVARDAPHLWQHVGEAQDPLELLAFLFLAIFRVVEVLQPALRVVPYRLNLGRVAPGDARVLPRGRHLQVLDARQDPLLVNGLPRTRVAVEKASLSGAEAPDPGLEKHVPAHRPTNLYHRRRGF